MEFLFVGGNERCLTNERMKMFFLACLLMSMSLIYLYFNNLDIFLFMSERERDSNVKLHNQHTCTSLEILGLCLAF